MNLLTNRIVPLLCTLALTGCGILPAWLSFAHTATDIVLTSATGKSSGEHLLSGVTGEDCKFIRVIDTNQICMTKKEYEVYLLTLKCDTYQWDLFGRASCAPEEIGTSNFGKGAFSP
jgi:hypothetical protein